MSLVGMISVYMWPIGVVPELGVVTGWELNDGQWSCLLT